MTLANTLVSFRIFIFKSALVALSRLNIRELFRNNSQNLLSIKRGIPFSCSRTVLFYLRKEGFGNFILRNLVTTRIVTITSDSTIESHAKREKLTWFRYNITVSLLIGTKSISAGRGVSSLA